MVSHHAELIMRCCSDISQPSNNSSDKDLPAFDVETLSQNACSDGIHDTWLSQKEQGQLKECEGVLRRGLGTFFEVGSALLTIRERKLYRATHTTFESYCCEKWEIGRSYAWRVIGAAERLKLLLPENGIPKPTNEFQMRPFLKLAPEQFPVAWRQVVTRAQNGKVTSQLVHEIIHELSPKRVFRTSTKRPRHRHQNKLPFGQILVLLHEAKRCVEKSQTEQALAALERVEQVLFGPKFWATTEGNGESIENNTTESRSRE